VSSEIGWAMVDHVSLSSSVGPSKIDKTAVVPTVFGRSRGAPDGWDESCAGMDRQDGGSRRGLSWCGQSDGKGRRAPSTVSAIGRPRSGLSSCLGDGDGRPVWVCGND